MIYVCTACKKRLDNPTKPLGLCPCGNPLSVHYDWEGIEGDIDVKTDDHSLWRYKRVLPNVEKEEIVSLGEGWSPLIPMAHHIFIKDETVNPTGSFKVEISNQFSSFDSSILWAA